MFYFSNVLIFLKLQLACWGPINSEVSLLVLAGPVPAFCYRASTKGGMAASTVLAGPVPAFAAVLVGWYDCEYCASRSSSCFRCSASSGMTASTVLAGPVLAYAAVLLLRVV